MKAIMKSMLLGVAGLMLLGCVRSSGDADGEGRLGLDGDYLFDVPAGDNRTLFDDAAREAGDYPFLEDFMDVGSQMDTDDSGTDPVIGGGDCDILGACVCDTLDATQAAMCWDTLDLMTEAECTATLNSGAYDTCL